MNEIPRNEGNEKNYLLIMNEIPRRRLDAIIIPSY